MSADHDIEDFVKRAPTRGDAKVIAELIAACQQADGDEADMTVEELLHDWATVNLAEEAVLVTTHDGKAVGYADLVNRRHINVSVYVYVHPDYQGQGIGEFLIHWGEAWTKHRMHQAPPHARVDVQHFVRATNRGLHHLLEERDYVPVRTHYWMTIDMDVPPPQPEWPEGIVVRSFVLGQDDQTLYEVGEAAFHDIWGRPPSTLEKWLAPTLAEGFDPTLWFLAEEQTGGEIAGICLCSAMPEQGVVNTLGVRRPWRRQGLGLALLHHAFGAFFQRGVRHAGLSVDAQSITGAPRLYTRAGMQVAKSYVLYREELRPGEDLTTQAGRT